MSLNFQALTLGEAELYIDDQQMGIATEIALTKTVERMPVETVEDASLRCATCCRCVELSRLLCV